MIYNYNILRISKYLNIILMLEPVLLSISDEILIKVKNFMSASQTIIFH